MPHSINVRLLGLNRKITPRPHHSWRPGLYSLYAIQWTVQQLRRQLKRVEKGDRKTMDAMCYYFKEAEGFKVVGVPPDRETIDLVLEMVEDAIEQTIYMIY
jgi:hypothetical protein